MENNYHSSIIKFNFNSILLHINLVSVTSYMIVFPAIIHYYNNSTLLNRELTQRIYTLLIKSNILSPLETIYTISRVWSNSSDGE